MYTKKFGPKQADHPSISEECPACKKPFKEGDYTTLLPIGPGDNEESRKRAAAGAAYNAVAIEVHWECSAFAYE